MQRACFLDTVNSVALFIFLFITLSPYHGAVHTTEHGSKLSVPLEEVMTVHNTSISLLLSTSAWVLLSPQIERRESRPIWLNFPVHRRCGERRSPKVQPSTRRGIEPGTFWLAVRDLTNCANLAHADSVGNLICMRHIRRSLARGWGNLFTFGGGLDRIKVPCMWGIFTVWFCLMANAPYFPGMAGGWGLTLTGA